MDADRVCSLTRPAPHRLSALGFLRLRPAGGAMLICRDRHSISDITDGWSREIQPPTSREELLDFFETAWWRGQWKTDGPLTPLALLKSMYRSARERDLTTLVFVTKEDETISEGIELADGGLLFDVNELERPAILVPSNDPETWTEASCAAAFEVLSRTPSRKHYPDRTIQFLIMEIDRHQFVRLLTAHGLDLPKFWRPPISEPPELEKEARVSSAFEPSSPKGLEVRQRGRKPTKFERVKEAMRRDIREGQRTMASIDVLLEKDLVDAYGGFSRDTMRKARTAVLSEMVEDAMKRDLRESRRTADSLRTMREKELGETYGISSDIASKARTAVLWEIVEESNHDK